MRKFVVGCAGLDNDREKEFIYYIGQNNLLWWHWIDNFWMLVDNEDQVSAVDIRDKLKEIAPGQDIMILQIPGEAYGWAGYGPTKKFGDWMRATWIPKEIREK
jgi:hypothetical protein